jgi:hypothetical protein
MSAHLDWLAGSALTEMPDLEQGSDEWHDQRRGIVTASVVGQLITVGYLGAEAYVCPECAAEPGEPCRSKVKRAGEYGTIKTFHAARTEQALLYRNDRGSLVIEPARNDTSRNLTNLLAAERITGWTEPTYVSDDMWRGITDEPLAVDVYAEHYAPVTASGFMVRENGWKLGYSPDGLVGKDGAVEVKSRRQKNQLTTILAGEIPTANMAQLQCGLLVSGRQWIDYISYSGGMPLWVRRVTPDPRWFDAIVQAVNGFEHTVAEMVATYNTSIEGLPMTERVVEPEMSL